MSQELNANVKYERHEEFWDTARKPNWKKLVYAIVPDESARVAGIQTGALDIAYGLTGAGAEGIAGNNDIKLVEIKETGLGYCMMLDNVFPDETSPLKDLRVRKALLMAVDRAAIAKSLYKGYASVPQSGTPKITPGFNPDAKTVPFDPEGAKALLAEAGAANLELQLSSYTTTTVPDMPKLAETIAQYWAQIGVKATLNNMETATYLPQWRNKQLKGAAMIAGPTYFYVEPTRLSVNSFFWQQGRLHHDRGRHRARRHHRPDHRGDRLRQAGRAGPPAGRPHRREPLRSPDDPHLVADRGGPERRVVRLHHLVPLRRAHFLDPRQVAAGPTMLRYILSRLAQAILVLFVVATVVFGLSRASGNAADLFIPQDATDETKELVRAQPGPRQAAHRPVRGLHGEPGPG